MYKQALAGEVGMSNELDDVARSLYNGHIPLIWRRLAPATLKSLGNWMLHFQQRHQQYHSWVTVFSKVFQTSPPMSAKVRMKSLL